MDQFLRTFETLSDENKVLLKKSLAAGVLLYIVLLAIHDLLPYALVGIGALLLFKWSKSERA